jgi:hypothetical protein
MMIGNTQGLLIMFGLLCLPACAPTRSVGAVDPQSIGVATMDSTGSIHMQLRGEIKGGGIAEAIVVVKPNDSQYQGILRHVGGLKPGETKSIPPWPD